MNNKINDHTGKRAGRLTVLEFVGVVNRKARFRCKCDCGNEVVINGQSFACGHTKSCGCISRATGVTHPKYKHGESRVSAEYRIWVGMINRCTNPKLKTYKDYGGKGISICDSWRNDYRNFIRDIGKRPSDAHSIDRIDVYGNYEPSNCRWATIREQSINKGLYQNNKSGCKGVTWRKDIQKWVAGISVDHKTIHLGHHRELGDAVSARKAAEQKYWAS